jgi:tetratricopeptide (TPR) repeat protein
MQPINEIYKNLFSKRQQYESITPAVEKLITHDIKKGIAVPNATIVLYALLSKNGEAEKAKQIFEWVINDKRWLLRALPDILIYTIIDNDLPKVDIGKITESMEDKIFHQFPERYLMLVIVYMLHGLYSRAEEAFKLIKTRFPKLFINKSKGETTLNRWFLLSICHKLNNDNKQATHFLELAFIIDREQEKVWNHLISKIEEQRHIPFTKIEIPNFATG